MTRATPRPAQGSAAKLRRARKHSQTARARDARIAAKVRDGYTCRRCGVMWRSSDPLNGVEAAHIVDAGMGGRFAVSNTTACYVTLCARCHRTGKHSVHSGHVVIVAGPQGGDGPVQFIERTSAEIGSKRSVANKEIVCS